MLEVKMLVVGPLEANCFLIYSQDTKETVVVDPGADPQKIQQEIADNGLKPILIVNTHGHVDHIAANGAIKKIYQIPIAIHSADAHMLEDPNANLSNAIASETISPPADRLLQDGDSIPIGNEEIRVVHTPGHSPGGISLLFAGTVLPGDVLFKASVGRTDLPGSDFAALMNSIQAKLETLGDETVVYPGHGPKTTIGEEKRTNPFLLKPPADKCCE